MSPNSWRRSRNDWTNYKRVTNRGLGSAHVHAHTRVPGLHREIPRAANRGRRKFVIITAGSRIKLLNARNRAVGKKKAKIAKRRKTREAVVGVSDKSGTQSSRRLFVVDNTTGLRFLIDTGAEVPVVPPRPIDFPNQAQGALYAANGSRIEIIDERAMILNLGLRRPIRCVCVIAKVPYAILGADVLYQHNLTPDLRPKTLKDMETGLSVKAKVDKAPLAGISSFDKTAPIADILTEFKEITKPS